MTKKIYRSAQGKPVDLGTIMLQNEHVRAVGNMKVNARGDKLDNNNHVVETKPRQIQRQVARTTNVSTIPVETGTVKSKRKKTSAEIQPDVQDQTTESTTQLDPVVVTSPPAQDEIATGKIPARGLAAAIARSREVKQELEKTMRQRAQEQGLRKI